MDAAADQGLDMPRLPWCIAFFVASHAVGRLFSVSQRTMGEMLGAAHAAFLSLSALQLPLWHMPWHTAMWHSASPVELANVFQAYLVLDGLTLSSSEAWGTWLHHALYLLVAQLLKHVPRFGLLGMCLVLQEISSVFLNCRRILPQSIRPLLNQLFVVTFVCMRIVMMGSVLIYVLYTQPRLLSLEERLILQLVGVLYMLNCWWLRKILALARTERHQATKTAAWPPDRDATVVVSSGMTIAYRLHHSRLPQRRRVLFLHGMGADLTTWSRLLDHLPTDTAALCLDLRDCGQSTMHHGYTGVGAWLLALILGRPPYSVHDLAQDAVEVAAHVWGGDVRMHVVGHSLGGLVANSMAQHYPDRLCSVVGIATGSRSTLSLVNACRLWCQDAPSGTSISEIVEGKVRFYAACAGTTAWTCWHRQHQLACIMRRIHSRREYAEAGARLMMTFWCARMMPTEGQLAMHVIHGSRDAIFPTSPACAAQVEQIAGLGHMWTPSTLPAIVRSLVQTWDSADKSSWQPSGGGNGTRRALGR